MLDFGANPQLRHLLLRFTRGVAAHVQGSLPAGRLAFAGWESNPLDRYERFQFVLTTIPPSCSPDASAIKRLRPTFAGWLPMNGAGVGRLRRGYHRGKLNPVVIA